MTDFVSIVGDSGEVHKLLEVLSNAQTNDTITWDEEAIAKSSLSRLHLSDNNLSSFTTFAESLPKLVALNLSFNNIKDLGCLRHLTCLRQLDISHNKITSLDFTHDMTELTSFRCNDNKVGEIESLKFNTYLTELWISNNNIPWAQFAHLNTLKELKTLVKYGNPCEEKPKLGEFLEFLIPSLLTIDGISNKAPPARGTGRADAQPKASTPKVSTPKATADVRVMLTQARALNSPALLPMPRNNKRDRQAPAQAPAATALVTASDTTSLYSSRDTSSISSSLDDSGLTDNIGHRVRLSSLQREGRESIDKDASSIAAVPATLTDRDLPPHKRATVGIKNFKSRLKHLPKKFIGSGSDDYDGSHSINGDNSNNSIANERATELVLKFNSKFDDAPVAACLFPNKDGFSRWSKNGPVACSWEGGRLLCSYKTGAIAVICDERSGSGSGSGSVMDSRGRCVLLLSEDGTAQVMNSNGTLATSFTRNNAVAVGPREGQKVLSWVFEGMRVKFDPCTWEVAVTMRNEQASCDFSTLHGTVIRALGTDPVLRNGKNKDTDTLTVTGTGTGTGTGTAMNKTDQHQAQPFDNKSEGEGQGQGEGKLPFISTENGSAHQQQQSESGGSGGRVSHSTVKKGGVRGMSGMGRSGTGVGNTGINGSGMGGLKEHRKHRLHPIVSSPAGTGGHTDAGHPTPPPHSSFDLGLASPKEHDAMRAGIQGVFSDLDAVLSDIKSIRHK